MDLRQQRRLLWILGKLTPDMEEQVLFDEEEEDELFQWWWEATVPEIEKQVAEFEGQQFDDYGAMWISDGLGGVLSADPELDSPSEDVGGVKWIGLETAKRLHRDEDTETIQKGLNDLKRSENKHANRPTECENKTNKSLGPLQGGRDLYRRARPAGLHRGPHRRRLLHAPP